MFEYLNSPCRCTHDGKSICGAFKQAACFLGYVSPGEPSGNRPKPLVEGQHWAAELVSVRAARNGINPFVLGQNLDTHVQTGQPYAQQPEGLLLLRQRLDPTRTRLSKPILATNATMAP